ncbi:MAG TPA: DNA repair protein RecO [Pontiella sp.]
MIVRATAIPLSIFHYSSTSSIVHWMTRQHGKVSTLLKGAYRPKSPFLGEYGLFDTSELLFFTKRMDALYTAKECALLHSRKIFRSNWRAMQAASYLTALLNKTTPENAPHPELFDLFEELLDLAEKHGQHPQFLLWAELYFCTHHGHSPSLGSCVLCHAKNELCFCASQGGTICQPCAKSRKLPTLPCPPDILSILQSWQKADQPAHAINTRLSGSQLTALNTISSAFMNYHFNLNPKYRNAVLATA